MARFLFDEPLSEEPCEVLATSFLLPCTFDCSGRAAPRMQASGIWRVLGCFLVSKDEDLHRRHRSTVAAPLRWRHPIHSAGRSDGPRTGL